jgi:hypothetical protein
MSPQGWLCVKSPNGQHLLKRIEREYRKPDYSTSDATKTKLVAVQIKFCCQLCGEEFYP